MSNCLKRRQFGGSLPNCLAYSAFSRFSRSLDGPLALLDCPRARSLAHARAEIRLQLCQPAAPHEIATRVDVDATTSSRVCLTLIYFSCSQCVWVVVMTRLTLWHNHSDRRSHLAGAPQAGTLLSMYWVLLSSSSRVLLSGLASFGASRLPTPVRDRQRSRGDKKLSTHIVTCFRSVISRTDARASLATRHIEASKRAKRPTPNRKEGGRNPWNRQLLQNPASPGLTPKGHNPRFIDHHCALLPGDELHRLFTSFASGVRRPSPALVSPTATPHRAFVGQAGGAAALLIPFCQRGLQGVGIRRLRYQPRLGNHRPTLDTRYPPRCVLQDIGRSPAFCCLT